MYIEINNHPMPSLNRIWIRSRFTLEPSWIWIWSGQDLEHIWNTGAALPSQWKIQACFPKKNLRRDKPFISQLPTDGSEWTHFGNTEGLWKLLKKKKKNWNHLTGPALISLLMPDCPFHWLLTVLTTFLLFGHFNQMLTVFLFLKNRRRMCPRHSEALQRFNEITRSRMSPYRTSGFCFVST